HDAIHADRPRNASSDPRLREGSVAVRAGRAEGAAEIRRGDDGAREAHRDERIAGSSRDRSEPDRTALEERVSLDRPGDEDLRPARAGVLAPPDGAGLGHGNDNVAIDDDRGDPERALRLRAPRRPGRAAVLAAEQDAARACDPNATIVDCNRGERIA